MANATAAQAYTAVTALEAIDVAADGSSFTVKLKTATDKIILDNAGVLTTEEALVGIRLAQGAADQAEADSGDYHQKKVTMMGTTPAPAVDTLFATDGDLYVTSLS